MPERLSARRESYRWAIARSLNCPPSEQDRWSVEIFNQACDVIDMLNSGGDD